MVPLSKYFFILFILFFIDISASFAQKPELNFKHISTETGLSNSTIEAICQDHRGFIWFGTRDGLNRYDGYQMTVYRTDTDSTSISDNYIRYIYEDRQKTLWIATNNGLNKYDETTNRFTRYKHDSRDRNSISSNIVTCIYEDRNGSLWISTQGGLNLFDRKKGYFTRFRNQPGKPGSLPDNRVNYLFEDQQGNFWVATRRGLSLFNRETMTFSPIKYPGTQRQAGVVPNIIVINQDDKGMLWLGTEENGLFLFNYKNYSYKQYLHDEKYPSSLGSNLVRCILRDKDGKMWVGSINGGLDLFDPERKFFFNYKNIPGDALSLSQRTVSSLFEDRQGNFWVGTHRGGVNVYMPDTYKFRLYRQEADDNSLSYNDVRTFFEDKEGNIWIGTDGGGLNLFDPTKGSFRHYQYHPFDPRSIGSNEILDIMEDSRGNLWVSTWGGGLCLLDRKSGRFTRFMNNPEDKTSISSDFVQKVFEDRNRNLWVATYYGGLNILDSKTMKFRRFIGDTSAGNFLKGNNIVSINQDRDGNLWFGTDDGGLNCYDPKTRVFSHYFDKEENKPDLRIIFNDSKGRMWVGQRGLFLFDNHRKSFSLFSDPAGLSDEFIKGIIEDHRGNFWIATSNGITQMNPDNLFFKKYNTGDGLQGLEFEANSFLKARDGRMFFGGINGFNAFYPDDIKVNKFVPPVYITDFQVSNKKVVASGENSPLKNDIVATHKISLTYKQSTFSFGFAALNFTGAENNQYAYKLDGWDKDWNFVGTERRASYNNVSPGTYTFYVKASNNDGVWNQTGTSIVIIITPPFWATWWFRLLAAALVISAVVFYLRIKRKYELSKLEERKKEEIHQSQLQFFTNISHEFRTPLSLILGPLEKLQSENISPANKHYLKIINRNAGRLMNLINELMDFRKAMTGAIKLRVMAGDITLFLNEIYEEFIALASQKNIRFRIHIPSDMGNVWFDRQIMEKICVNLIGNAFKYTPDGGDISVNVLKSLDEFEPTYQNELVLKSGFKGRKYMYVQVKDNGIGISKESIAHLFERYYRVADYHLGSGIGLAFVKSLTFLHKGNILVYSEREKGTEIIMGIPVAKEDYKVSERWNESLVGGEQQFGNHPLTYDWSSGLLEDASAVDNKPKENEHLPHVLIVDDNVELRKFLKDSLGPEYHISEAGNGMQGWNKVREEMPDLIISDVMMPEMDGIEFCKQVKNNLDTCHIPFIMLTAKEALESRIEGVGSGADFYFAKPLSIQLLEMTISNILSQRERVRERYTKMQFTETWEKAHSALDRAFMDELINIIVMHLANPDMDVDYLCMQMGMSRTKLYQKIKGITGKTIGELIRTIRLKKAADLMAKDNLPLQDVMYQVGIQTQSYFTKAFKKEFGKTPTEFIRELTAS